jgi:hypothetical protein
MPKGITQTAAVRTEKRKEKMGNCPLFAFLFSIFGTDDA